ncbi:type II toxin-antitoxin system VapC family toxin [Paenibacillus sp. JCM 10914]|uniref:type II toxin-antitoxin system VapC family toxin n=1 Tax=Paenibacillus sp. JCM 10914 TaxID=1236974 RepID=UPI0003CC7E33|nr:type II toxin-antitoxin system VapC family toxin [Paenibacillus sp. JCM 10914]GAE09799.1 PilT protein-like [Paenibacillus sp. JCM 10914]
MSRFLFDTNICIYYLEGNPAVLTYMNDVFREPANSLELSVITEAELFSSQAVYGNQELTNAISGFVNASDEVAEITREVAVKAGEIRSYFHKKFNRKIKLPDALIAATAIVRKATLVTNNDKDFVEVMKECRIPYVNPIKSSVWNP